MTATCNIDYYLHPSKVFNKVKRMHKRFVSKYVNNDYIHEFQMPTTLVSYYNLNELKHVEALAAVVDELFYEIRRH